MVVGALRASAPSTQVRCCAVSSITRGGSNWIPGALGQASEKSEATLAAGATEAAIAWETALAANGGNQRGALRSLLPAVPFVELEGAIRVDEGVYRQ